AAPKSCRHVTPHVIFRGFRPGFPAQVLILLDLPSDLLFWSVFREREGSAGVANRFWSPCGLLRPSDFTLGLPTSRPARFRTRTTSRKNAEKVLAMAQKVSYVLPLNATSAATRA